jgi:hypothetical protein
MFEHIDALIAFTGIILVASLMVTIITQIVILVLNLRGRNLLWGVARLLQQIEPSLGDKAKEVARKILTNPLICRYKKRLPPVIRMEEFSDLLIKLAESKDIRKFDKNIQRTLKKLTKIDEKELAKQLEKLPVSLVTVSKKNLKKAQKEIFNYLKKARTKIGELESWFDNMNDRISERFALRSKIIALIGAILVAGILQLDSIQLMKQVFTDAELRSKLIVSADLLIERGGAIIGQRNVFDLSMDSLLETIPDFPDPLKSFSNRVSAEKWLEENLPEDQNLETVLATYRDIQKEITKERLDYLGDQVLLLNNDLNQMQLKILGEKYSWKFWEWKFPKFLGILISIALLSLGAPFWFNMLKNLANLRTRLIQNEEKERLGRGTTA